MAYHREQEIKAGSIDVGLWWVLRPPPLARLADELLVRMMHL